MRLLRWWMGAVLALGLLGCDGEEPPDEMDAGTDAGPPPVDAGPPLSCEEPTVVEAVAGGTVSVMFDTSMTETRPRDLGLACGNSEAELRWAPQEVVELRIPEDAGAVTVRLDTVFDETLFYFNTVLQVREQCDAAPSARFPPSCFDDIEGEILSQGSYAAEGGDVLYVFVTGFSDPPADEGSVDEGPVRLDITLESNTPPTLTEGGVAYAADDVVVRAQGTDPEGNAAGVALTFFDADGEVLDLYGDGVASEEGDVFVVSFAPPPTQVDYSARARVRASDTSLGPVMRRLGAATARMRVFDRGFALSEPLDVDVVEAELVGFDEACDAMRVCRPEMTCVDGTCGATGAVATACDAAIDLGVAAPTDTATSARRTGSTGAGFGLFLASAACVPAGSYGQEAIYTVDVPDGVTADLLLSTDFSGTRGADTVIYVREACPDSGSELGCNDNLSGSDSQSEVEVRDLGPGTYYVFVEFLPGVSSGSVPHELEATLRPVLATGATCDEAEIDNRCAAGACAGGVCP